MTFLLMYVGCILLYKNYYNLYILVPFNENMTSWLWHLSYGNLIILFLLRTTYEALYELANVVNTCRIFRVFKKCWLKYKSQIVQITQLINPFHVAGFFSLPLKISENQRVCNVFTEYWRRPMATHPHCIKSVHLRSISPYSVWLRENTDQKNSKYGYFLRSDDRCKIPTRIVGGI